jgi:hypothetical protein
MLGGGLAGMASVIGAPLGLGATGVGGLLTAGGLGVAGLGGLMMSSTGSAVADEVGDFGSDLFGTRGPKPSPNADCDPVYEEGSNVVTPGQALRDGIISIMPTVNALNSDALEGASAGAPIGGAIGAGVGALGGAMAGGFSGAVSGSILGLPGMVMGGLVGAGAGALGGGLAGGAVGTGGGALVGGTMGLANGIYDMYFGAE